jgi:hypothetical protein
MYVLIFLLRKNRKKYISYSPALQYIQTSKIIMFSVSEVLIEVPLENRIRQSDMSVRQQDQFVNMLGYFTVEELQELQELF